MTTRITAQRIQSRMWGTGRPSTDRKFADVYFAACKAGLSQTQAFALACAAFDAAKGNVEGLSISLKWVRQSTLNRKADEGKRSLWAYLRAKLGAGYIYVTDAEIRDTSMNHHPEWAAWADSQEAA